MPHGTIIIILISSLIIILTYLQMFHPSNSSNKIKNRYQYNPIRPFTNIEYIDIVYMWVNGQDKRWQRKTGQPVNSRNRNNDELKYSLRSLDKYLKWHKGRIIIVTPNQVPEWIKVHPHGRVHIIDQNSIIPRTEIGTHDDTITSNSFYIEAHLCNIPGLSENFIYINDDCMIAAPMKPSDFFKYNGKQFIPVYYNTTNKIKHGFDMSLKYELSNSQVWLGATYYTNGVLNAENGLMEYNAPSRYFMSHAPYSLNVTQCIRIYKKYKRYIEAMRYRTTRHWRDVVFMLLYRYECYGYNINAHRESTLTPLVTVTDDDEANQRQFAHILQNHPLLFTVNDEFTSPQTGTKLTQFLHRLYPEKSLFEK